ncbi:MAG: tetratricopeptide repeat protein [Bacteroidales bacterium]
MTFRFFCLTIFLSIAVTAYSGVRTPSVSEISYPSEAKTVSKDVIARYIEKATMLTSANPDSAQYYANMAIAGSASLKDYDLMAQAQRILSDVCINKGDFVTSFEVLTDALQNCSKDNKNLKGLIYINLSVIYGRIKDIDKALDYADKAVALFTELKDTAYLAKSYNAIGLAYIQDSNDAKAEQYFKKSLELNKKTNNIKGVAQNLNNLGLEEGNSKDKIEWLKEAIAINDSYNRVWMLGENYNNLGVQYYYSKDYAKATEALSKARTYAERVNAQELLQDNDRYFSWVCAAKGDYKQAYTYLRKLTKMIESSDISGKTRNVETNLLKQDLINSEKEKALSKQEYDINKNRLVAIVVFISLFCILLIIIFMIVRYHHRKKVQMLESQEKLDLQEKELIKKALENNKTELNNFAFYVKSRNDIMAKIQSELKQTLKFPEGERAPMMRNIISSISQFCTKNDEASVLIDNLNSEFIGKLQAVYPSLTKNEQRLASLLRIGMSSKEISLILSVEPKSVDMARYRLRRKMNMASDEDLSSHLCNL